MEYSIEVLMRPHLGISPKKPYFWCIKSRTKDGTWCMHTGGWSTTPDEAWYAAQEFYDKYIANQYIENRED